MTDWDLEGELTRLGGQVRPGAALAAMGLIARESDVYNLGIVQEWHPAGAETYLCVFSIVFRERETRYVLKACTSFGAGIPLRDVMRNWLFRREYCADVGVVTPRLHAVENATILEEHVQFDLGEALSLASGGARSRLLVAIGHTCGLLSREGFHLVSAHDWRSHGEDVVLVDFGEDLGPPRCSNVSGNGSPLQKILEWISRSRILLSRDEEDLLKRSCTEMSGDR